LNRLHPLVGQALIRRGFSTREAAKAFLDPKEYNPTQAGDLPGLAAAATRIEWALRLRQPICVWGDFDVDGQMGTTILYQTLKAMSAEVSYYIPMRSRESHGLNIPRLQEFIDQGIRLVITCDTGITCTEAVEYARSRGVDVVITDHHDLPSALPQAIVIATPRLLPEVHPLASLSGAGIAYKLAEELLRRQSGEINVRPIDLLDITALGLITDLVPLIGDTRYLVQKGLKALRTTKRIGIQVMMELAELDPENLTEEHVSFVLGPRLNSLGRLGDARPAVELLTTQDMGRARQLATQLENYNAQRQLLTSQVIQAAEAQLRADPSLLSHPILVLANQSWPAGVTGIAAVRLAERYHRPVILFSAPKGAIVRGSARSVPGINITQAIAAQSELVMKYGGHAMAAGLALAPENLTPFIKGLSKSVEQLAGNATPEEPSLRIDAWLDLPEVHVDLATALEKLAPYGAGNERLILASRNLVLHSATSVGRNKEHHKLVVSDSVGNAQQVFWWNGGNEILPEGKFDLAYTLRAVDWRGSRQMQMELIDFRPADEKAQEITRRHLEIVDLRGKDRTEAFDSLPSGALIWAEAEERNRIAGFDRNSMTASKALAIWTIPPSPEELQTVLEIVKPQMLFLVGAHAPAETIDVFMERLTGLLKYAIKHHQGHVTYNELAAGTGQRIITVQRGLGWLIARGNIILMREEEGKLWVEAGATAQLPAGATRLWSEIQSLLAEAAAYHKHFLQADPDSIVSRPQ
jgi:single-stranded-DNA-specific exonuclease